MDRIFLLSPARATGKRAQLLLGPAARCALAMRLRETKGVALGEIFSFLSGLYFRGKLAYAQAFGRPPQGATAAYVITPNRGLVQAECLIDLRQLRAFSRVDIDESDPRYRRPLLKAAEELAARLPADCDVVLLGSISTRKYSEILLASFAGRLLFPSEFIGRGDMSRGGLMLRAVAAARELTYAPVEPSVRRGKRPPKLIPLPRKTDLSTPLSRSIHATLIPR